MTVYPTEVAEFDAEHNVDTAICHNQYVFYEDGAMRVDRPGGECIPPPYDSYNRAKARAQYHRLALEIVEHQFRELKAQIEQDVELNLLASVPTETIENSPHYKADKARLEEFRDDVFARRELRDKADADTEYHRPPGA